MVIGVGYSTLPREILANRETSFLHRFWITQAGLTSRNFCGKVYPPKKYQGGAFKNIAEQHNSARQQVAVSLYSL